MAYQCRKCNRQFEKSYRGECPYCGSEKLEKVKHADELLDEIGDMLERN